MRNILIFDVALLTAPQLPSPSSPFHMDTEARSRMQRMQCSKCPQQRRAADPSWVVVQLLSGARLHSLQSLTFRGRKCQGLQGFGEEIFMVGRASSTAYASDSHRDLGQDLRGIPKGFTAKPCSNLTAAPDMAWCAEASRQPGDQDQDLCGSKAPKQSHAKASFQFFQGSPYKALWIGLLVRLAGFSDSGVGLFLHPPTSVTYIFAAQNSGHF